MTSSVFPGALDTFLSEGHDWHSDHTHIDDAVLAIQTALGTTGAPGPLLQSITTWTPNASGDTTGAADTTAIQNLLTTTGTAILAPNSVYYFNAQLLGPSSGPGLLWIPPTTTLRLAANTRLTTSAIVPWQWAQGGTPSAARNIPFNIMGGGTVDLNVQNQNWTGAEAWLTNSITTVIGPDGIVLGTTESICDVQVINATRHSIVCAGANSAGTQPAASANMFGNRLGPLCRAFGWEYFTPNISVTGCTTAASTASATVPNAQSNGVKIGMYVFGQGVIPGTIVTAVPAGATPTVTFSQKLGVNPGTTLKFAFTCGFNLWIQNNTTDGWIDDLVEMVYAGGIWGVQADNFGGWRLGMAQLWAHAYGGVSLNVETQGVVMGPSIANMGHEQSSSVGIATLSGNLTVGVTGSIAVNAIPVALSKNTPIVIPGAGLNAGPVVTALSANAAASATSLSVYQIQVQTQVNSGGQINYEMVGLQRIGNPNGPNVDIGAMVYQIEMTGSDICYHQWISQNLAGPVTTQMQASGAVANNNSNSASAGTSVAFSFIEQGGNGVLQVSGTKSFVSAGQNAPPLTTYTTAGPGTIIFTDNSTGALVCNPFQITQTLTASSSSGSSLTVSGDVPYLPVGTQIVVNDGSGNKTSTPGNLQTLTIASLTPPGASTIFITPVTVNSSWAASPGQPYWVTGYILPIPAGTTQLKIEGVASGGQGGGGGTATLNTTTCTGGGGGGAGQTAEVFATYTSGTVAVSLATPAGITGSSTTAGITSTKTIAGVQVGTNGNGGAASGNNNGTAGLDGGNLVVAGTGFTTTLVGGGGGAAGTTGATAVAGGKYGAGGQVNSTAIPGIGGIGGNAATGTGNAGSAGFGMTGGSGGGGGPAANAGNGGGAGTAGGALIAGQGGNSGGGAAAGAGANASGATLTNYGAGGGGGGGSNNNAVGGNGAFGALGRVIITPIG